MPAARTLADLTSLLSNPARPFITYHDQASGERTELSAITTANWVAKTSNFLIDDLEATPVPESD